MVPRTHERSYISVFKGSGCSSSVGRQGGMQRLKLGPNCASNLGRYWRKNLILGLDKTFDIVVDYS